MATGHDLPMAMRAAYWAMHRCTDATLARHGVTADQFVLLVLLAEEDGITQQELVRRASSDANTVRAMLVLLEGRKLVSRRPHPTDGRARCVTLTAKGRKTHSVLLAAIRPLQMQIVRPFGAAEVDALVQSLTRIAEAMNATQSASETPPVRSSARSSRGGRVGHTAAKTGNPLRRKPRQSPLPDDQGKLVVVLPAKGVSRSRRTSQ